MTIDNSMIVTHEGKLVFAAIPTPIVWTFSCDRCGNTAPFRHGMETWHLTYTDGSKDNRTFCSQICVREVYETEKLVTA
jgi:hypothetical protein